VSASDDQRLWGEAMMQPTLTSRLQLHLDFTMGRDIVFDLKPLTFDVSGAAQHCVPR
jgi:hypothetical protein